MAGRRHLLAARQRQFPSFFRALAQHHHSQQKIHPPGNWPRFRQNHSDGPDTTVHIVSWLGCRVVAATTQVRLLVWTFSRTLSFGVAAVGTNLHLACTRPACTPSKRTGICTSSRKCSKRAVESCPVIWVHSSVVRAADCRSAGPWFKSGCALLRQSLEECRSNLLRQSSTHFDMRSKTSNRK